MRLVPALLVLVASRLSVGLQKLRPDLQFEERPDLNARQYPGGNCSSADTCSECYGPGNVICSYIACFDPSAHEQCCADASYCVAANNSCCGSIGPGVTGTDGVPSITANIPEPSYSTFECTPADTGEECCQQGGSNIHWCSGSYPNQYCYNPASQFCCTNGVVCDGAGCCALISASPTTPYISQTPAPSGTNSSALSTRLGATSTTQSGTSRSATTTATMSSNSGPSAVAARDAIGCGVGAAVGLIVVILL